MTTQLPVPAERMPATGTTHYTHRTWLDEMADALGQVAGIYRMLAVMSATLHEVEAGKTQLALVADCEVTAMDVMTGGVRLVKDTDARYLPVFEAIRTVGADEVVKNKHYHDRD